MQVVSSYPFELKLRLYLLSEEGEERQTSLLPAFTHFYLDHNLIKKYVNCTILQLGDF